MPSQGTSPSRKRENAPGHFFPCPLKKVPCYTRIVLVSYLYSTCILLVFYLYCTAHLACACILLNHRWGLFTAFLLNIWYGVYWRWLYYVRDIDQVEVAAVINCGQKKNSVRCIGSEYHISDRNDGHDDGDGSTRAYPSRTNWGAAYSLAEKFPFLFERRFGIRAYDYWYGYTA